MVPGHARAIATSPKLCCLCAERSLTPEQHAAAAAGQRPQWRASTGDAEHAVWASGELIWDAVCAASPCKAASLCVLTWLGVPLQSPDVVWYQHRIASEGKAMQIFKDAAIAGRLQLYPCL